MARHFLKLYALIVATLAIVSWGQERLWQAYARSNAAEIALENRAQAAALTLLESQLEGVPLEQRKQFVADVARATELDFELFDRQDVAWGAGHAGLEQGGPVFMQADSGRIWALKPLAEDGRILAFRYDEHVPKRGPLDWALAFTFYAAIAFVLMLWLWPLTRDLRRLEAATMRFGDRNWTFDAEIRAGSPIHSLATAFKRMAARIDSLVGSQRDLSNALSHEIKTPLSRMRFELEMARTTRDPQELARHLDSIEKDVTELNAFVTATLEYAILERAEVALNLAEHDFTQILPALTESIRRSARTPLRIDCEVAPEAKQVRCDAHLMETVLRNLLYNAIKHARERIVVSFAVKPDGSYRLCVEDDGPGIPEADRSRVFDSFVQLDPPRGEKTGYGLGLAIVKRIVEWHGGTVNVGTARLGGAGFSVEW